MKLITGRPLNVVRSVLVSLVFASGSSAVMAQTFRLDDSTSPRARVAPKSAVDETGRPLARSLEPNHAILRFGEVVYRLDMRPHLGQAARVYFVRAPEAGPPTNTRLNWAAAGSPLKGSLLAGERALLWSGIVNQPWMDLNLQLEIDFDLLRQLPNTRLGSANQTTYFELER